MLERNLKLASEYQVELYKKFQTPDSVLSFPEQILFGVNENQVVDNVIIKVDEKMMAIGTNDNETWLQNINASLHTIIVFGLGMGGHIEALIKRYPDKKVIAIEPDKRVLYHAMQIRDFEFIFRNCTVWMDEPADLIRSKIYEMITHPLARGIMLIPFYSAVYQSYFNELTEYMKKVMNDWAVMINTKRCLVDKWYENRFANAKRPSYHGKALIDAHKGMPGIIVGAGPSLKGQLAKLKEIQGKCVMIAASTAVEILHNNGIRPTYAAAIDQDPVTSGGLHEHLDSDVPLIFDGQVAQNSLNYKGPKIQMQLNVNRYVTTDLPVFESGPSITNVVLDMLHKMGCDPILIVGMDMSYTDNKLYCDGTQFNQDIRETNMLQMQNNKGEMCYTEPSFISMRNWFEEYVARVKPNVFNCTERGLVIKGIPNRSLDEFTFDREVVMPEFELVDIACVEKINAEMKAELTEIKAFIEANKTLNPAFQKYKSWVLIDEYVQAMVYLEEIRSEARIKKGMEPKESAKIFYEKRIETILGAVNKLLELL
jgi:hypothetical protein